MTAISVKVINEKDVAFILRWLMLLKGKKIIDFKVNDAVEFAEGEPFTQEEINQMLDRAEQEPDVDLEKALEIMRAW
jgi:hypothetical protein